MALIKKSEDSATCQWMVWEITESAEFYQSFLQKVNADFSNLQSISHPKKQLEWLASRFLMYYLLEKNNVKYQIIEKDEHGKPQLLGSDYHISISHTLNHVAAAFHPTKSIGIDLEDTTKRLLLIRKKFLNDEELEFCGENLEKLCIVWSAKESLYKLHGQRQLLLKEQIAIHTFKNKATQTTAQLLLNGKIQDFTVDIIELKNSYLTIAH